MKKSPARKIIIGTFSLLLVCVVSFMLFINWANQPENVQASLEMRTQEAIQATQDAQIKANADATATAVMAQIDERLSNASLVFEENFDTDSAFLAQNAGDQSLYMEDDMPKISLSFPGFRIWQTDREMGDFAAELDCEAAGEGSFCGLAYGIQKTEPNLFYASYISSGGYCGFDDHTSAIFSSKGWYCNPPASPAAAFLSRLRVERFGLNLRFYVNGKLMDERILSNEEARRGSVGVYTGRQGSDNSGIFYVRLDHFSLWELP